MDGSGRDGALGRRVDLPIAFSVALKQVIGGGVVVLTMTAIGLTGGGAAIAYGIACAAVLLVSLPYAVLGAARPVSGSLYRWPARLIGRRTGFLAFWMVIGTHVGLAAYAETFGRTLHALLPAVPVRAAGAAALVAVVALNLSGTTASGRANLAVTAAVAAALAILAAVGLPSLSAARLRPLLPHGWSGMLGAAALLTFPIGGATLVAELSGEMRRPGRDVPVAILGATALAALLYVGVALVAAGAPGAAGAATLTGVADAVLGGPGGALFGIAAGLLSMLGIMNTHLLWGSRSILMVCRDGWLPRRFGEPNRAGAPTWPLLLLGAIGLAPVLAGLEIGDILRAAGLGASMSAIASIACAPLEARRDPARYAASPLAIPLPLLLGLSAVAIASQVATIALLLRELPVGLAASWLAFVAAGGALALARAGRVELAEA